MFFFMNITSCNLYEIQLHSQPCDAFALGVLKILIGLYCNVLDQFACPFLILRLYCMLSKDYAMIMSKLLGVRNLDQIFIHVINSYFMLKIRQYI